MSSPSSQPQNGKFTRADIESLFEQARAGDEAACEQIYHQYTSYVYKEARRHLKQPLRRLYDSSDVVQMVWQAFFDSLPEREKFQDGAQLVKFLKTLTRNKVLKLRRDHLETQKRSLSRDVPLPEADHCVDKNLDHVQQANCKEDFAFLLHALPEHERQILLAGASGMMVTEIVLEFKISTRSIWRLFERWRQLTNEKHAIA